MVVRQSNEAASKKLMYNVAGGIAILLVAAVVFKLSQYNPDVPSCDRRYTSGVLFSLARESGELLTISNLRERLQDSDWGLATNARVMMPDGNAIKSALEIELRSNKSAPETQADRKSGIGFRWQSPSLETAISVCLSYSVWVPAGFNYGAGGRLPGMSGGRPGGGGSGIPPLVRPFFTRISWQPDGVLVIAPGSQHGDRANIEKLNGGSAHLTRGAWTRIDQEVILNRPRGADGLLRVWVNGALASEHKQMVWRGSNDQRWLGVDGDTHYARAGHAWMPAPVDTKIRLTPFELRLQ